MANLEDFGFELSNFQKISIKTINEGNHVLVTAHTGSGKTLPAEYAIKYFNNMGKKVIYTAPIKALSNQKYYEFSQKFPNISFGILTGDVKFNPEADVLIMTTEILCNTLYLKRLNDTKNLDFEMDIENELGCVVFDEVHYINDADRGKVWEETIMLLPSQVQMVMLSATIDKPERFAMWVENVKKTSQYEKKVILTGTNERVVPLAHYMYFMTPTKYETKDPTLLGILMNKCNHLELLKGWDGERNIEYQNDLVNNIRKIESYHYKNKIRITKIHVLNNLVKTLYEKKMLPAICFVFSRAQCHIFANAIQMNLLQNEDNKFELVQSECRNIISKLPNYKEYIKLPEYCDVVKLLEKGIAVHHSGVAPVLREMIEIMFSKGYIKLLFATETFAVGINMPTKTVIFTGLNKYSNKGMRMLHSHEYTQMAGRAGRRGLDKIGHVIHCCNIFDIPLTLEYKDMMDGKPQQFVSKFKISYNIVLNLISEFITLSSDDITNKIIEYISKSMMNTELESDIHYVKKTITQIESKLQEDIVYTCDNNIVNEYVLYKKEVALLSNKKKRRMESTIKQLEEENKTIINDYDKYCKREEMKHELKRENEYLKYLNNHYKIQIECIIGILIENGYINKNETTYSLTQTGKNALCIKEVNSLVMNDFLKKYNYFNGFDIINIISLFSCFVPLTISEENNSNVPETDSSIINNVARSIDSLYVKYSDYENNYGLDIGEEYVLNYNFMNYIKEWCNSTTEMESKRIIQVLQNEKNVFLGEFIKALVKIVNISKEVKKVANNMNEIELENKLSNVENLVLKYIVSTESLYL